MLQAWAREQESEAATGNRHFDFASSESQDVFVPWTLPSRFKLSVEPIKTASTSDEEFKSNEITLESVSRTALVKQQVEDSDHTAIVDKFERRRQRNERKREKTRLKLESRSQTDIPFKPRGDEDKNGGSMPSPSIAESSHVIDQPHNDREVLQRYCHVYARGELEDICSSIPNCRLIESGYDRGNWFVKLKRINDERLVRAFIGTEASMPIIAARSLVKR